MKNYQKFYQNKIWFYILAFSIPVLLYGGMFILLSIAPFGKHTFLVSDMQKQYIDFYQYYKSILSGSNDIFYTFGKCLGGDMFGFYTYYLLAPHNLLFLLVGEENLPIMVSLVIMGNAGLCGLAMSMYLRYIASRKATDSGTVPNVLRHITLPSIWVFSTSYAFISFFIMNSSNILWHSAVILFPIVLLGLDKIASGEKMYVYLFGLGMALLCNYYMAYMICIFSVFYFLVQLWRNHTTKEFFPKVGRFAFASLLAASLNAFFLLPTFFTIGGSLKDDSAVSMGITHTNVDPLQVLSKLFTFSFDLHEYMYGLPNLFCGILILVFVLMYFLSGKITLRDKISYLILFTILMVSFCLAKIDFVWHAFIEPSGYPYRYSYMFSALLILLGYQGFLEMLSKPSKKQWFLLLLLLHGLMIAILCRPIGFLNRKIALLDLILCNLCILGFYLYHKKVSHRRGVLLFLLLAGMQVANLGLNATYTLVLLRSASYTTLPDYQASIEKTRPVMDALQAYDTSFYRMENLNPRTKNDTMHYGYAGLTHYSSNEQYKVLHFLQDMGFNYNKLLLQYGMGSTMTADSLLGIKYLVSQADTINKPYPELPLMPSGAEDALHLYQNPYHLPLAYVADPAILSVDLDQYHSPFAKQEIMLHTIAGVVNDSHQGNDKLAKNEWGTGHVFQNALQFSEELREKGTDKMVDYVYHLEAPCDGLLYFYGTAKDIIPDAEIYLNDAFFCNYYNLSSWNVLSLGSYQKGDQLTITIKTENAALMEDTFFVVENEEALKALYQTILQNSQSAHTDTFTKISSSKLTASLSLDAQKLLLLSIPYEENWQLKIDGEVHQPQEVFGTLMALTVPAGDHQIDLQYVPKGLMVGAVISLVSFLLLFACVLATCRQYSPVTSL